MTDEKEALKRKWDMVTRILMSIGAVSREEGQRAIDGDVECQKKVAEIHNRRRKEMMDFPPGVAAITAAMEREPDETADHYKMRMLAFEVKSFLSFFPGMGPEWDMAVNSSAVKEIKALLRDHPEYRKEFNVVLNHQIFGPYKETNT